MLLDVKIIDKITRLDRTYDALRYVSLGNVPVEMVETRQHFRSAPDNRTELHWRAIFTGEAWGDDGITAWFRGQVTIPETSQEQTLFLRANTGAPEALLLIDGRHYGVFDVNHPVRLLTQRAVGGARHWIHLEAYAGHTIPGCHPFDAPGVGDGIKIAKGCRKFGNIDLVREREEVSQFVFDLRALHQLARGLEEKSLRRGRIHAAFQKLFALVYARPEETEESVWMTALEEAREIMRPLLESRNGSTAPRFGIIGHSHIDTAWLWSLAETKRKLARTFSSVLSLMDQYPEFRFTQSAAYHSVIVRDLYPEIFSRIQQRVREGRWEINGAMWIEPDCNIPSGESLVRQCLVGQRATREMFGITSDTLWQPDVFGYSAALPQILRGAGVEYFCTTKLGWNDTNRFPYDTFIWQGIDGSTVLSHFNLIHCTPDPETLIRAWKEVQHTDVQDRRLMTFGYGDGGGGPMAEMIEMARRTEDLEGCPKAEYATISEFMTGCREELTNLPRWVGELYLELHRGTLTSIAKIKRLNRQCEFALREAEFAATIARLCTSAVYPAEPLLEAWKKLLLNQFHDILPGSSIAVVNDEAIASFEQCLSEAESLRTDAWKQLAGELGEYSVLLANSLSWDRTGEFELTGLPEETYPAGEGIVAQEIVNVVGERKTVIAGVPLPALGYRVLPLTKLSTTTESPFVQTEGGIETPFAQIRFDDAGCIISFYDRTARRELVSAGGVFNGFLLGEDVPAAWDSWDVDRDQRLKLQPQEHLLRHEVIADGPLQLRIRQEYRIGRASTLRQDIVFHARTARVDFETVVDWHEKFQLLKVGFAVDVLADTARHEIQFGHVTRTTHDNTSEDRAQFDVCAHKWTDISENGFGVAFLNDCKYACTIKEGEYRLTLLKSGRHPDARGDEGIHRFVYSLLPHSGGFSVESVVRPAYERNLSPLATLTSLGEELPFSLAQLSASNIIVESVKAAEEGEGIIIRLYEASRTGTHVSVKFGTPMSSASETNLLEESPRFLPLTDNSVELYFRPFEIKTLHCVPLI